MLARRSSYSGMPSGARVKEGYKESQSPFAHRSPFDSDDIPSDEDVGSNTLHALDLPTNVRRSRSDSPHSSPEVPSRTMLATPLFPLSVPSISSVMAPSISPPHVRNSITAVTLGATGMRPLHVDVDRYAPPSPSAANFSPRVSIHMKLSLSSLHDVSSPPVLHGFTGAVTFAAPWTSVAQCVTRVYAGDVCESEEYAYFQPVASLSPVSVSPITVPLPESELSRCRLGNTGTYTLVTAREDMPRC